MGAVDGRSAAIVVVEAPSDLAGRVAECFAALTDAHGGRIASRTQVELVATFPDVPKGMQAAAELLALPESPNVRCGVMVLDCDAAGASDVSVAHAQELCRTAEPGQVVVAAQSAMLARSTDGDNQPAPLMVGRRREAQALSEALSAARSGRPQALTIAGELGSGRSTLLAHVRGLARARGFGVVDVIGVGNATGGRWTALRAATFVSPGAGRMSRLVDRVSSLAGEDVPDESAVVHELITQAAVLTDAHPVLVAIDDVDQLDDASRSVLRALAAGLAVERCLVVATGPTEPELGLGGAVLQLPDLPAEDVERIIERDGPIDADVLRRCVQLAGGNALAAREVSRSLSLRQRAGQETLRAVPEPAAAVLAGFRELLAGSSDAAQRAAIVAAADDTGDSAVVRSALIELGEDPEGLDEAETAGLIRFDGSGLRFTHPLLRSVAYHQVAAGSRRAAHQALAVALNRPSQATARAYQLAAAAAGPHEGASEALALVAETELARGDVVAAARACATAARLTAGDDLRDRRLCRAATLYVRTGELASANAVLVDLSQPELLADAAVARGLVDLAQLGPARARTNLARAGAAPALSTVIAGLDAYLGALAGDPLEAIPATVPLVAVARVLSGLQPASTLLSIERSPGALGALEASVVAHVLVDGGWPAEAREAVRHLEVDPEALDSVSTSVAAGLLALETGRPIAALEILGDAGSLPAGTTPSDCLRLLALARARLYCGRLDDADQSLREAISIVDRLGLAVHEVELDVLGGLTQHARGRAAGIELLTRAARKRPDRALPDLVIAALDRDESPHPDWKPALETLAASPVPRASLAARRALGVLVGDAEELVSVAKQFEDVGLALESTLTRGAVVATAVRAGDPEGVRLQEDMAHRATQSAIVYPGSHYWNHEGPQVRLRKALSPAEHRVAVVVGTGATNKEVSAQLFISVKTVDYHLQNIYRKLGARSRTELAVLLAGSDVERGGSR